MCSSQIVNINDYKYTSYGKEFFNKMAYSNIQIVISLALIQYRKLHSMTQKDLAEKLEINQSMVAKLEKGTYNPTIKFLFELSNKLTGDYTFFIKIMSEISKIAKEDDKRNKEIYAQVDALKAKKKKSTKSQKVKKSKYTYNKKSVVPQTKVSEDEEEYKS